MPETQHTPETPEPPDAWTFCGECGARLKRKSLSAHLQSRCTRRQPKALFLLNSFKSFVRRLWNRETKESYTRRVATEQARRCEDFRKKYDIEVEMQVERTERANQRFARRTARKTQDIAYQKFLETNEVTQPEEDPPVSILDALAKEREERRLLMRRIKDSRDSMSD